MNEAVKIIKNDKNKKNRIKDRINNKLEEYSKLKCLHSLTGNLLFKRNLTLVLQERINKSLNITSNKSRIPNSVDLFNIQDIIHYIYGDYIKRHNIDINKEVMKIKKEKEKKMREINSYAYLAKNKRPYFNQKINNLVLENTKSSSNMNERKNYSIVSSKYTKKVDDDSKSIKNRNKKSSKENNSIFNSNTRLSKISNISRKISDNIKDYNDTVSEYSFNIDDSFYSKSNADYFFDKSKMQQVGNNCGYYTRKITKKRKLNNKINDSGYDYNTNIISICDNNKSRDYSKIIINSAKKLKNKTKDITFIRTDIKKIIELKHEPNNSGNKNSNRSKDIIISSRLNGAVHEIKNLSKKIKVNKVNNLKNENNINEFEVIDKSLNQENNNYILSETINNDTNDEENIDIVNGVIKKNNDIKIINVKENIKDIYKNNQIEKQKIIIKGDEIDVEKNNIASIKKKNKRPHKHHHHYEHNDKPRKIILATKTDFFSLKGTIK